MLKCRFVKKLNQPTVGLCIIVSKNIPGLSPPSSERGGVGGGIPLSEITG